MYIVKHIMTDAQKTDHYPDILEVAFASTAKQRG